ncbi:FGGY-family carbohydrate kinase [Nocardioides marmoraquaticus]
MAQATCGVDVGTSGVRAVVALADGTVVGTGSAALRSHRTDDGRHEQDPRAWWEALTSATRAATDQAGDAEVVAVAIDSTSGTILVQAADGGARGPALMYDDRRAADLADEADAVGRELWASLGHAIAPTWALPRVLWLLRHGHVGATDTVVHQGDHLSGRLVGRPVATDTSQALKTGVDLRAADWSGDVLDRLGVPRRVLPDVVLPGTVLGTVSGPAARETGLPAGAEVRAGMTDGCAAQVATGALSHGSWSSALGTTLVLKGATAELVRDPAGAVYCHRHPDGGWLPGGASTSGAGVLGELLPDADLDSLTQRLLREGDPRLERATYPLVGRGERFPFLSDTAPSTGPAPRDELERFASVCLGLALVERLAYDVLAGLGADTSGEVTLSGGATRNAWLNQLRADVLGRPAVLTSTTDAAFGMAVLAAAEPGGLTTTAARMVRHEQRLEPDPERGVGRGAALAPAYDHFVSALVEGGWLDPDRLPTERGPRA